MPKMVMGVAISHLQLVATEVVPGSGGADENTISIKRPSG